MSNPKRFEGWGESPQSKPSCGNCESYYDSSCSGVKGYCNAYKRIRYFKVETLLKIIIAMNSAIIVLSLLVLFGG